GCLQLERSRRRSSAHLASRWSIVRRRSPHHNNHQTRAALVNAPAVSVRPELKWLCAATLAASAATYLIEPGPGLGAPAFAHANIVPVAETATSAAQAASASRPTLSAATADPFEPIVVAPPPSPPVKLAPPAPPPP